MMPVEQADDEEELDEPDVTLVATPPIVGHTFPLRIPMPTEEEIVKAAATMTHPSGACHPMLCSKEGMKYCLIDEVKAIKKIAENLIKNTKDKKELELKNLAKEMLGNYCPHCDQPH